MILNFEIRRDVGLGFKLGGNIWRKMGLVSVES